MSRNDLPAEVGGESFRLIHGCCCCVGSRLGLSLGFCLRLSVDLGLCLSLSFGLSRSRRLFLLLEFCDGIRLSRIPLHNILEAGVGGVHSRTRIHVEGEGRHWLSRLEILLGLRHGKSGLSRFASGSHEFTPSPRKGLFRRCHSSPSSLQPGISLPGGLGRLSVGKSEGLHVCRGAPRDGVQAEVLIRDH